MKKFTTGLLLAAACLACSGCLVLATVVAIGAVATTSTSKTTNNAATAEPARHAAPAAVAAPSEAPARPASAANISRQEDPAPLTAESAAGLAQAGSVVVVDLDSGTRATLPWQDGMTLAAAVAAGKSGNFHTAKIYRGSRLLPADLRQEWTAELALLSGDVVELRH